MRCARLAAAAASLLLLPPAACSSSSPAPFVGGYVLLSGSANGTAGLAKLALLAQHAETLPLTRLWLAFASPTMSYVPGSRTLALAGMALGGAGADGGFAAVAAAVAALEAAGVRVFLSMGGWDLNCFPFLYTRYSVAGYGTGTPNYWKIQQ